MPLPEECMKKGHPDYGGGRPRTTSLPAEDLIKLGEEMIEWLSKNPGCLSLAEWYTLEKKIIYKEWKLFLQKPEFRPYYEQALALVGRNYLDGTVRDGISHRFLRNFFIELREREDEDADLEYARKLKLIADEARLKAELGNQTPEETKAQLDSLLALIASSQSSRKMEANKSKDEIKS